MTDQFFFGYGSLVNLATHSYHTPTPARLDGWRRIWRHTPTRKAAYLSATMDPDSAIDGIIAGVPGNDWSALDIREQAYQRLALDRDLLRHEMDRQIDVQIYQVGHDPAAPPRPTQPILLSYLDVVVQGYHQVFGEDAVTEFFDTTSGWEAPVLNDRDAPIYPRHQRLSREETELVDGHLARLSARIEQL